jgi:hypothetical protein
MDAADDPPGLIVEAGIHPGEQQRHREHQPGRRPRDREPPTPPLQIPRLSRHIPEGSPPTTAPRGKSLRHPWDTARFDCALPEAWAWDDRPLSALVERQPRGYREAVRQAAVPDRRSLLPTLTLALRLVTCGGEFDATAEHYRSNVIVFATLNLTAPARAPVGRSGPRPAGRPPGRGRTGPTRRTRPAGPRPAARSAGRRAARGWPGRPGAGPARPGPGAA